MSGAPRGRLATWTRRVGVGGIVFFTVKGLAWLVVPALIAHLAG